MTLHTCFKTTKTLVEHTKFVRVYRFVAENTTYTIVLTKRFANKHTIIHCAENQIVWQQIPALFNWGGNMPGVCTPIYKCVQDKHSVTLFVVRGKPNGFTGLDDGVFRSANTFDKRYINVMSYSRFKNLQILI